MGGPPRALSPFGSLTVLLFYVTGPFTIIIGTPSKVEDVIKYADFTQKVSPVELFDESTLDEEPNSDDLQGLMDGNIKLNASDVHVLPAGKPHCK